ncbi:MAG: FtsX-like permease family protein [Synergistaceae bacterium]|jgi:putative ABC transport system permease protein|nr:FtsX-like permease family protein [Synergistaceae bacterium]
MKRRPFLTFSDVAVYNLKRRPFRTACLVSLVAALAFVLFGGSLITYSLINGTEGLAKRLGADILIVPKGYDQMVEGILLRGEPSTFYMNADWIEKISALEGIRAVSPHLFVASLNAACCSVPIQLIGFDQETDFIVTPWLRTALPGELGDDEIVIGGSVSGRVGDKLMFFDRSYRIAAKMENTGTGFDASIFMNMNAARRAAGDYGAKGGPSLEGENGENASREGASTPPEESISSLVVLIDDGLTAAGMTRKINNTFGYGKSGIVVVPTKTIIGNVSGGLRALTAFTAVLVVILWILSLLVLTIVFSVTLNERKQEFGILRSLGITRKKLIALVFLESGTISLTGAAIGVFLSALLILPFRIYIQETISMPYMQPSLGKLLAIAAASLFLSFATGPLASLFSSSKMGSSDAYVVIREGGL